MKLRVKWLVGCVSATLLGACAALEGEDATPADSAAVAVEPAAQVGDVAVSLSVEKSAFAAREAVSVTVTYTNTSRHPVSLLKWYTPVDGMEEALFEVQLNGEPVDFVGPHYKRPAAQESDFIRLAAGERLKSTVEISGFYDLSKTGAYSVKFAVDSGHLQGAQESGLATSNPVDLWIEGRPGSDTRSAMDVSAQLTSSVSYTNCTATQQSTVLQALNAASTYANGAVTYLNGTPSATPRYTTWFGTFSTTGWNTAKTQFVAIKDAFDTKPITVDCRCKKQYYAYVYPTQPYKIYVCSVFWSAPMTGTDSKAGTLIHEMSHFDVVAGTDDWAYGHSAAKSLAISDPTKALNNADSHEYFAENTPTLQ